MRKALFAFLAAAATVALIAPPAEAAPKRKTNYAYSPGHGATKVFIRDENGRARTRIIVTRRSYLDGGTEVVPGERKFTDYAIPPRHDPFGVLGPGRNSMQYPLPNAMGIYNVGVMSLP